MVIKHIFILAFITNLRRYGRYKKQSYIE